MKALFEGIVTRYNSTPDADTLRTLTPGGIQPIRATADQAYPFINYTLATGSSEFTMPKATSTFDDVDINFSFFTNKAGPDDVTDAADEFDRVFNNVLIPVVGFSTLRVQRINSNMLEDEINNAWQYVLTYNFVIGC